MEDSRTGGHEGRRLGELEAELTRGSEAQKHVSWQVDKLTRGQGMQRA